MLRCKTVEVVSTMSNDDAGFTHIPNKLQHWLHQHARIHQRSIDDEVIKPLEATRLSSDQRRSPVSAHELLEIGRRCAALPVLDHRSADEILGYNPHGLLD